jgi:peptidoglycan hydrolase-like protein with peptidoglycan-binding domain
MLRVIAEDDPSHISVIPDGIYGPETLQAVTVFQRKHGLPATGITDQSTWEAIVREYTPAAIRVDEAYPLYIILNPGQQIQKGERHPHILLLQSMLTVLADTYSSIAAPSLNGLLDDATADSISSFQYLNALPMTGNLDKQTWKHIALHYPLASNIQSII